MPPWLVDAKVATVYEMTWLFRSAFVVAILASACSRTAPTKEYQLQGQILDVKPETSEVLVKHGDIPGFMPAMTMPYKVEDPKLLSGKEPGDLITATLVVGETEAHLSKIDKTGHAPIEDADGAGDHRVADPEAGRYGARHEARRPERRRAPADVAQGPSRRVDVHVHALPAARLLPADGSQLRRDSERRSRRHPALGDVRLVSVSFDPANDTPPCSRRTRRRSVPTPRSGTS